MTVKHILLTVFLIFIILSLTLPAFGSNRSESKEIGRILNDYGKAVVIELIVSKRYGAITTKLNDEYYGRPREDLVTVNTILRDLEIINLDTRAFEEELKKFIAKKKNNEKRLVPNNDESKDSALTRDLAWCKSWLCDEMRRLAKEKNRVFKKLGISESSTKSLQLGADEKVFTPVENDFSIVFPKSVISPNPKIEIDGERRTYISGFIPIYMITAIDVSKIYDTLASSKTSKDQSELEEMITILLSEKIISNSGVTKGKREEISFKGRLAVMYEYYKTEYIADNSPSKHPGLHLDAIFTRHTMQNNKTTLYGVSFLDYPKKALDSKNMVSEFREFLNTFNFIEHIDYRDLPEASVSISSTPFGASLFVDGKKMGITPRIIKLKAGYHMIELSRNGYSALVETLEIEDNSPVSINYNLSLKN